MVGKGAHIRVTAQQPVTVGSYREPGELVDVGIVARPGGDAFHAEDVPIEHQSVVEVAAAEVLVLEQQVVSRAEPENTGRAHVGESKGRPNDECPTHFWLGVLLPWCRSSRAKTGTNVGNLFRSPGRRTPER